jgi:hypothetical protein
VRHVRGTVRWGRELDVRAIERDGPFTPVASYVWPSTPPRSRPCTPDSWDGSSPSRT